MILGSLDYETNVLPLHHGASEPFYIMLGIIAICEIRTHEAFATDLKSVSFDRSEKMALLRLGVEPRIRASKAHVLTTYTNRAHPQQDLNLQSFD